MSSTGATVIGLTYDPVHDELFTARRGGGAFRNGAPIRVSGNATVDTSCLALAYSFRQPKESYVAMVDAALTQGFEHRRAARPRSSSAGSATAAATASSRSSARPGTASPGLILVEEAGGLATDFVADHGLLGKGGVAACTPALAPQIEQLSGLRFGRS